MSNVFEMNQQQNRNEIEFKNGNSGNKKPCKRTVLKIRGSLNNKFYFFILRAINPINPSAKIASVDGSGTDATFGL